MECVEVGADKCNFDCDIRIQEKCFLIRTKLGPFKNQLRKLREAQKKIFIRSAIREDVEECWERGWLVLDTINILMGCQRCKRTKLVVIVEGQSYPYASIISRGLESQVEDLGCGSTAVRRAGIHQRL